jgi:hypothetical protein
MKIPRVDKRFMYTAGWALSAASLYLPAGRFGDRLYAFFMFLERHGRFPHPSRDSFLDLLYSLKSSGELYSLPRQMISDKEYAKLFINSVLEADHAVPTHSVLRSPDEVRESAFPKDCAIKPTHASGKFFIRRNGAKLDLDELRSFFDVDLYRTGREQNYRFLERKIIVEPIVFNEEFIEISFQCLSGKAKICMVKCENGKARVPRDRDWKPVDIKFRKRRPAEPMDKPEVYNKILRAVEKLASRFNYIRVDVYTNGKEFLIGELTNCHTNASHKFLRKGDAERYDRYLFGEPNAEDLRASSLLVSQTHTTS